MQLDISQDSLPVYEALASSVRLTIIQLLSKKKMSVKELASELGLSSAIVTMHVKKLETAGLITTDRLGRSKVSSLKVDSITVNFPKKFIPPTIPWILLFRLVNTPTSPLFRLADWRRLTISSELMIIQNILWILRE